MNETLEQEITTLERELEEKKSRLEQEQDEPLRESQEKDVLHSIVGEKIQENMQSRPEELLEIPSQEASNDNTPEISQWVKSLVTMALDKSPFHAITEATKTKNPALIDAFHDALVDDLYDELVSRRKIEKIAA